MKTKRKTRRAMCVFCGKEVDPDFRACRRCNEYKGVVDARPCPRCKELVPADAKECDCCEKKIPVLRA